MVPIVSVGTRKILHLWPLVPIVSVKCPASWRDGSAGRVVSAVMTMTYGGYSNAGIITAYKRLGFAVWPAGALLHSEGVSCEDAIQGQKQNASWWNRELSS